MISAVEANDGAEIMVQEIAEWPATPYLFVDNERDDKKQIFPHGPAMLRNWS